MPRISYHLYFQLRTRRNVKISHAVFYQELQNTLQRQRLKIKPQMKFNKNDKIFCT